MIVDRGCRAPTVRSEQWRQPRADQAGGDPAPRDEVSRVRGSRDQPSTHRGGRFSTKAVIASTICPVWTARICVRFSIAIAAAADCASTLWRSTSLVMRTPKGALATISAASSRAASSSWSAATTRLARPMRAASSASTRRPVSISSLACPVPTMRGRKYEVPMSAPETPIFTKATLKRASGAARRTSEASASASPPPAAGPLTAAMTGWGRACSLSMIPAIRSWVSRLPTTPSPVIGSLRSRPAQKPRPAPVSTTTRTAPSPATSSSATWRSSTSSRLSALRRSGRLSVSRATPGPSSLRSTVGMGSVLLEEGPGELEHALGLLLGQEVARARDDLDAQVRDRLGPDHAVEQPGAAHDQQGRHRERRGRAALEGGQLAAQEGAVAGDARPRALGLLQPGGKGLELGIGPRRVGAAGDADDPAHERLAGGHQARPDERDGELVAEEDRRPEDTGGGPPAPRRRDVERDQALDALGVVHGQQEAGEAAPVVRQEPRALDALGVEQREDVGGEGRLVVVAGRGVGPAPPAQVDGHHAVALGERADELAPRPPVLWPAVQQHQRRGGAGPRGGGGHPAPPGGPVSYSFPGG